jgi:release factor glutamine methyltransferase
MLNPKFYNPDFYWQSKKWLAFLLNRSLEEVLSIKPEDLEPNLKQKFEIGNQLLKHSYPLDYLFGSVQFCNQKFLINPSVLIPRPETEQWVLKLTDIFKNGFQDQLLVDIATGSGVIGITLSPFFKKTILSDICKNALQVCKQNLPQNHNIKVILADGLPLKTLQKNQLQWVLTANLPYLPTKPNQKNQKPDQLPKNTNFEPQIALYSGIDGLDCFNQVIQQLHQLQNKPTQAYFELDPRNIQKAEQKLQKLGYKTEIWKDFNSFERVLIGRLY